MRLIDADFLKKAISNNPLIDFTDDDIFLLIDNAPTVETKTIADCIIAYGDGYETARRLSERPQGEWIYPDADIVIGKRRIGKSYRVCSCCKEGFTNNIPWNANFCPNCGAEIKNNY